ncbi:Crp/Fnr family transcriptional regulator [Sphingomonas immobilis]|uniref:Crp/Fnr family transcriptional regulator n=1 Tax=Sphingomonas immobilis TaxID=3063997 RepID=A0ABT8ZWH1_9SPHN|nr:Crp/Fnr family transcriptional regulator [Sphingomonas sp. CA1-15]MDO7841920.1 Crp/Fnr family transcriptional regulator [Sphingomonas sp. CA1-15]
MPDENTGLALWLDRLTLRSDLNEEERAAVLALPGNLVFVKSNRDFVNLGEHVDRACLIVEGMAGRFGQARSGERQITALHIPGDMADLHSVALPKAATALQSIGECTIYRVAHANIRDLARRHPALAEAFWRDCVVDAAILSEWALVLGRLSADARVAHLLAELSCRFGIGECRDGRAFDWPLTQAQLGDATGLTPVHVNRMLRVLREAGAVDVKPKRVTILDWKRLCTIGQFDPRYLHLEEAG